MFGVSDARRFHPLATALCGPLLIRRRVSCFPCSSFWQIRRPSLRRDLYLEITVQLRLTELGFFERHFLYFAGAFTL